MSTTPILLLDGGLGTTLKDEFNAEVDGSTRPLWSSHLLISSPNTIQSAQCAFASAGADVILTATYQASFEGFANTKVDHAGEKDGMGVSRRDAAQYMRNAVTIARKAADQRSSTDGKRQVALSLGAYGAIMVPSQEYSGEYDEAHKTIQDLAQWHADRLSAFDAVWDEIDLVAFETVPLLDEVAAVREAMHCSTRERNSKKFWISCVFPGDDDVLPDGNSVEELVKIMLEEREDRTLPYAIGINCTKTSKVSGLIKRFEEAIKKMGLERKPALVVYPDGTRGEVYNTATHEWEKKEKSADMVYPFRIMR